MWQQYVQKIGELYFSLKAKMLFCILYRLSLLFPNTDIALWINIQRDYDIWLVKQHKNDIHVKGLGNAAKVLQITFYLGTRLNQYPTSQGAQDISYLLIKQIQVRL